MTETSYQYVRDSEAPKLPAPGRSTGVIYWLRNNLFSSVSNTILTVVTVTALSTIAMIVYPLVSTALGFSNTQAGIFIGGTIHDVAQVVGAGYSISNETGDTATYVKLLRVAMLVPVVFSIALLLSALSPTCPRKQDKLY